ncbi:MAG: uroporphyrinogen-III synthase, partial [Candidatus Binatia bacterium]
VESFAALLRDEELALGATAVACIGPATAETARSLGFRVAVEATEHTVGGLVSALVDYFSRGS